MRKYNHYYKVGIYLWHKKQLIKLQYSGEMENDT